MAKPGGKNSGWTRFWTGEMFPDPNPGEPEIEAAPEVPGSSPSRGTCFCGCGMKIGFTQRGVNKQGRRTVQQLGQLKSIRERTEALRRAHGTRFEEESEEFCASLDFLIAEGEEFEATWERIVHFDHIPPEGAGAFKSSWNEWGRATFSLAPLYRTQGMDDAIRSFILS